MVEDGQGALPSGYDIGGVRIVAALDRGVGLARYRARRLSDDSPVLVMEYALAAPAAGGRETSAARCRAFRQRAEALLALRHPNVLAVDCVLALEGALYLILDIPPGRSLAVRFRAGETLDEAALLALLYPLLDAVAAAHAAGVVHGRIGPDAIHVGDDFAAPVIDFTTGLPVPAVPATPDPDYAPYEIRAGEDAAVPATDIYGLAAVAYRVVAGEPPMDALARHREFAERKLDPLMPAVVAGHGRFGSRLLKAIDKALAVKPRDRPQSIVDWRTLFAAPAPTVAPPEVDARVLTPIEPGSRVAGAGTARAHGLGGTAPTRVSRRRQRGGGKMLALAVAVALAAGGYGYIRYDQARRQDDVAAAQAAAEKTAAARRQATEIKAREAATAAVAKQKVAREAAAAAAKQKAAAQQAARRKAARESAKRKAAASATRRAKAKAKAESRQETARQARITARTAAMAAARAGTKAAAGGDDKAAIASYDRAIASGVLSKALLATALYDRGTVYARMGRNDAAIADFTRALAIRPKDADLYYNRCAIYLRIKRRAPAVADCRMALKLQPGYTGARRALQRLGASP